MNPPRDPDETASEEQLRRDMIRQYEDTLITYQRGSRPIGHVIAYLEGLKAEEIKNWESLTGASWPPPEDDLDPTEFPADPASIELTFNRNWCLSGEEFDLARWHISADIEGSEIGDGNHHVGDISLLGIDLDSNPAPFCDLDALDGDLSDMGGIILNVGGRGLLPSLQSRLAATGSNRILIGRRAVLEKRWRGSGFLGALLAGEAIEQLSAGVGLVFVYPSPLDDEFDPDSNEPASKEDVNKLRAVWRKLGFKHYRDGVYVLDLSAVDLWRGLTTLREKLPGYTAPGC